MPAKAKTTTGKKAPRTIGGMAKAQTTTGKKYPSTIGGSKKSSVAAKAFPKTELG